MKLKTRIKQFLCSHDEQGLVMIEHQGVNTTYYFECFNCKKEIVEKPYKRRK